MNKAKTELFKEYFKGIDLIYAIDIKEYLRLDNPAIHDAAIRKEIYNLKDKNIITSLKRGVYQLSTKPIFQAVPDNYIKKIHKLFVTQYPALSYCIWSTQWLHQFMNLQPFKHFYVIESEKDILEPLFFLLKENNINAFLKPDKNLAEKYMAESKEPLVIKLIPSRSPIVKLKKIKVPTLEKMLTDVFCDTDVFFFYQGNELDNIFNNAFRYFQIDYSKLMNYADRRKQKEKLTRFLLSHIEQATKNLIS